MGKKSWDIGYKGIIMEEVLTWKHHLPKSYLETGTSYQTQNLSWECGPNSSGRALQMWAKNTKDFSNYSSFRSQCPKTLGMPQTTTGLVWSGILPIFTLGISKVGPTPTALADYISEKLGSDGNAYHRKYSSFDSVLDDIKYDIDIGDPVIALISRSSVEMHYINIVAVNNNDDVAYIDTDNSLGYYTREEFKYLLNCSNYGSYSWSIGVYNIIRFESNKCSKEDFYFAKERYGEDIPNPLPINECRIF